MSDYEEKMLAESKKKTVALYACFAVLSFIAGALISESGCIGKIKRHFPKIKIHDALYFPY
jgi:hypothetical protein